MSEYSPIQYHDPRDAEIERLTAALAAERERVKYFQDLLAEHGGRYWEARYRDEAAAVAKLREALEPFAEAAVTMKRSLGTTRDDHVYGVYCGDLRRARAVLEE
jgi:uncharacterized protein RhaS with RHS repeats